MFQLDLTSRKSIYQQVVDNFEELIMAEALSEGSKLPSVRELSKLLSVNPNTVQKAYRELERAGFVYTASGLGTFVSEKAKIQPDPARIDALRQEIREAYSALKHSGLSPEEAKTIVLEILEEDNHDTSKKTDKSL